MNMNSDPYSTFASVQDDQIRRLAQQYFDADDAIKAANLELKPYRQAKKVAKEELEELMRRAGRTSIEMDERGERLELGTRKGKRVPKEDTIRERCEVAFRGDANRIFDFIINTALTKVEEPMPFLKRRKLKRGGDDEEEEGSVGY